MPNLLTLAPVMALLSGSVPTGPIAETCGKPPSKPVTVDADVCTFRGKTIRISLTSPTGCWSKDDMTLVIEMTGRTAAVRWPGQDPTAWWMLDPVDLKVHKWKIGTICQRVDAVAVDQERVLLFVRKSGRPSADRLVAVLYDAPKAEVLDFSDVGPVGDIVARAAHELSFRQGEWGQGGGWLIRPTDHGLTLPDGDRLVRALYTKTPLNPVTRVWVTADKVRAEPDFALTFQGFERYFRDAKTFETAARRNNDFLHLFVRNAVTARGRSCVQFYEQETEERWASLPWYCETKETARAIPPVIDLPTEKGFVRFPHSDHVQAQKLACATCHQGGAPGKIAGFGKDAAHRLCKGCHEKVAKGPRACAKCHHPTGTHDGTGKGG